MMQQHFELIDLTASKTQLKRSNALRIKSDNFELLPYSLRQSLLALRNQLQRDSSESSNQNYTNETDDSAQEEEEEELSLLEQIRRGVKLRPVERRSEARSAAAGQQASLREHEETLATLLMEVLGRRYAAIQQTDDESDTSSMDSVHMAPNCVGACAAQYQQADEDHGGKCARGDGAGRLRAREFGGATRRAAARSLLEKLGDYSARAADARALDLTNDLTVRL